MNEFCIIGSGISGATIANLLSKKNSVVLFDKARGPGGRASFKRVKGKTGFDHGTQYISPKTNEFKKFTKSLIKKKILKIWGGKHIFLNSKKKENKKHLKIIGKNGNNDISKYLLKKINCNYQSELKKIYYKNKSWYLLFDNGKFRSYKNLILTCPFPQLKKLSRKFINNSFLSKSLKMDANITTMIAIKKNKKSNSSFLFEDPVLGWAGNENSKKRFKSKYDLWTLQSTFTWANKKINQNKNNKNKNSKVMIDKFFKLSNIEKTKINYFLNHGWKYSSNSRPFKIKSYWDPKKKLGVCADWFVGPRLESGWISAQDLFKKISK
jgi:predicted NAD/FAD-dependent oxidoreductase